VSSRPTHFKLYSLTLCTIHKHFYVSSRPTHFKLYCLTLCTIHKHFYVSSRPTHFKLYSLTLCTTYKHFYVSSRPTHLKLYSLTLCTIHKHFLSNLANTTYNWGKNNEHIFYSNCTVQSITARRWYGNNTQKPAQKINKQK